MRESFTPCKNPVPSSCSRWDRAKLASSSTLGILPCCTASSARTMALSTSAARVAVSSRSALSEHKASISVPSARSSCCRQRSASSGCPVATHAHVKTMQSLGWDAVTSRASAAGMRIVLYAALVLAEQALGADPPTEVVEYLRPSALKRAALHRAFGPERSLREVTEANRASGPGQIPFRLALLLCGVGFWGPWRLLWSRFWRHRDEVWLTDDGVPKWARSGPLFAGYRIATLASRMAGTAVRGRRHPDTATEEEAAR